MTTKIIMSNKTWSLKFVERYDLVTLTKGSRLCKAKQFVKIIWQHKNKTDKFFPSLQLHLQS